MTETTDVQPWAVFGAAMGEPEGLLPGHMVQFRRMEAAERAEEQRRAAEAQERADAREQLALWQARQYCAMRGLAWNPEQPFANLPSVYARADALFAAQDAEARRTERQTAREAGLEHLLPGLVGELSPPPVVEPAGVPQPPASRSSNGMAASRPEAAARATPIAAKVRAALNRWAHRPTGGHTSGTGGCRCASCVPGSVRTDDGSRPLDDGHERIRSFATEPRIIG